MTAGRVRGEAKQAAESPWVGLLGRVGLAAKGGLYALVAILAIAVATGERRRAEDAPGALATISDEPWGRALLVALAVGFAAYAVWLLAAAIFARAERDGGAKEIGKRAGYVGLCILYAGLCVFTVRLLTGVGEAAGGSGEERRGTAEVLSWSYGPWIVGLAGAAVIVAGAVNAYRALTQNFRDELSTGEMSAAEDRWYTRIGVIGHAARAVVFGLIGAFLVKAALEYDPNEAVGLDGALQRLVQQWHGTLLLGLVAAGLLAYGAFCLVQARYRPV